MSGLLQPDSPAGRLLVDLVSGQSIALEAAGDEPSVAVGRFRFSAAALRWGNARLIAAAADVSGTVLIDEVGPLELAGGGLRDGVDAMLARSGGETLLVVRETLVEDARRTLGLRQARLIGVAEWPHAAQAGMAIP